MILAILNAHDRPQLVLHLSPAEADAVARALNQRHELYPLLRTFIDQARAVGRRIEAASA